MEIEICKKQWQRNPIICGYPQCPLYKEDCEVYNCGNGYEKLIGNICPGYWGRNPFGK